VWYLYCCSVNKRLIKLWSSGMWSLVRYIVMNVSKESGATCFIVWFLKMEALCSAKTLVAFWQRIRRFNPQDSHFQFRIALTSNVIQIQNLLSSRIWHVEAACSSETSVPFFQTGRLRIREDCNIDIHNFEKGRSHVFISILFWGSHGSDCLMEI
jgi:hypothetical protein